MSAIEAPSEQARVRRAAQRGAYDSETIEAILDDGWVAHVGFMRDDKPVVIPTYYVRDGDSILVHGAHAAGMIRDSKSADVCVTVTHLDGLVLARSAFHHSMNYRSVVIHGVAEIVEDPTEKEAALELFVNRMVADRQEMLRPTTKKELQSTGVLRVSLANASAKVRSGDPVDDDEDYELAIWAGVVPMTTAMGAPVGDRRSPDGVDVPASVRALQS